MAQDKLFTLEDLNYGGKNYRYMTPQSKYYTWWGDILVSTEREGCVSIDPKTRRQQTLFTLNDINGLLTKEEQIVRLDYAKFPYPDSTLVMVENGKWRMLYDWKKKEVTWKQKGSFDANDWSAASRATAYVDAHQLYVRYADGTEHQLSTDGSREIVYGQSVHRDEFSIYKGTFWSPDGQRLAFYRMDQSMVADYPQVNISKRIATEEPDKYPMAGETSHLVTVGVYDMATQRIIYLKAGDPTDRYFTNIQWSPDSRKIYIFELNRDQTDIELVAYDAITGDREGVIYHEHNDRYAEPLFPITFVPWDAGKFILMSQRDGYNHLYLYDTKGKFLKQLTKGPWVVLDLVGFCRDRKSVVVLSTEAGDIQNNLYEVNLANGKRTLLDNGRGCHANTYQDDGRHTSILSTSGKYLYDNYTEPDVPRRIELVTLGRADRHVLFDAPDPWKGYAVPEFSCGTIKAADGVTDLYYRMVKPPHFDATKKYPTVIYVYGGPHSRNVEARWHYMSRGWETYMAQKGYVLFILDNRGSKDRGLAFEQATFRQLGVVETADQMRGVEFLKSLPYIDADRIGVHGWSFGGFMTITMMTTHPDVFKVGVAGGPVIDWKWYEVMYGERYMDTPQTNPEGYEKTSLIPKAKDLKGHLQIIQGMNDLTVVPQHCLSFLDACIKAGTQPDFFVYPGEPHNMRGGKSVHLHERITQYFEDYLR
ncbi:MAG: DPP IV N-terminal domain-containing protein [Prevotella sp.]|nr:DPP IV N-terminal domain-containing protein [Prevotella sp.]